MQITTKDPTMAEPVSFPLKKKKRRNFSLRQLFQKRHGSNSSFATCSASSLEGEMFPKTKRSSRRRKKVRFDMRSNTTTTFERHIEEYWSKEEELIRQRMVQDQLMVHSVGKEYMQDCRRSFMTLLHEVEELDEEDEEDFELSHTATNMTTYSYSQCRAFGEDCEQQRLERLLTDPIKRGLQQGYKGLEFYAPIRRERTLQIVSAVLSHVRSHQRKGKRSVAAIATVAQELTRADRQWARLMADGDAQATLAEPVEPSETAETEAPWS
jgi:hypothetical protein